MDDKIIVCEDCKWFSKGYYDSYSGGGCSESCRYIILGEKINVKISPRYRPYSYIEKERVNDYKTQNRNNDCEYFQEKFSIFKWIMLKLRRTYEQRN